MSKRDRYLFIPMMARLTGLWLFTAMWWGLLCLAPLQLHNQVIRPDLWLMGAGFFISLLIWVFFQSGHYRFSPSLSSENPLTPTLSPLGRGSEDYRISKGRLAGMSVSSEHDPIAAQDHFRGPLGRLAGLSVSSEHDPITAQDHFRGPLGRLAGISVSSLLSRKAFLVPLLGLMAADIVAIVWLKSYVLSFLITTLFLYTLGQAMEMEAGPISEAAFLLFVSSLGLGLTEGIMDLFRGRPQAGASFFSHQVSGLLHLLGQRSEAISGVVLFEGKKITCDLMKIGFFPWLAMALTFAGLVIFSRSSLKRRISTLIVGLLIHYLYLLVRFAVVALYTPPVMLAGFGPFNLFYWRVPLISFFPLVFIWFMLLYESSLIESKVAVPDLSLGQTAKGLCRQYHSLSSKAVPDLSSGQTAKGYGLTLVQGPLNTQPVSPLTLPSPPEGARDKGRRPLQTNWLGNSRCLYLVLFMLLGMLAAASLRFHGFMTQRKIHCVIDEIHSDWESSLVDFNQDIYGVLAENSYHSLVDYLRHYYPVTQLVNKLSMAPRLDGLDIFPAQAITPSVIRTLKDRCPDHQIVLILKCITTPFSREEIEVIREFIHEGGSALLIGDHTDVFFMNKNLNELAGHFGLRFQQNSIYFIDGGWIITDPPYYTSHPVTHHLDTFIWATGDSLAVEQPAFPLVFSSSVSFADEVNYFYDNFFGNTRIDPEEIFGSFCLMAGSNYGKGKIVAFTDSTCFNNYLMFTPGRRELLWGILGWLGCAGHVNPFLWLFLLGLGLFCFLLFRRGLRVKSLWAQFTVVWPQVIVALLIGWIMGCGLSCGLNRLLYPRPKPIRPLPPKVIIDASHEPRQCLSFGNSEWFLSPTSYDNLLFNIGRIDLFSEIIHGRKITGEVLDGASCLVIASPTRNYCPKERKDIETYVRAGGSLLLIEGAHPDSTANQIADLFEVHVRLYPPRELMKQIGQNASGQAEKTPALAFHPAWVDGSGGQVLLSNQDVPIVYLKRHGKGLIVVLGDSGLFMKGNFQPLGAWLTRMQCNLIEGLVNRDETHVRSIDWDYFKAVSEATAAFH